MDEWGAPALTSGRRLLWRLDAAVSGAVSVRAGARPERASAERQPRRSLVGTKQQQLRRFCVPTGMKATRGVDGARRALLDDLEESARRALRARMGGTAAARRERTH